MGALGQYTILELAGIGPAPMAGMMLADMGATVIRIDRNINSNDSETHDISRRGKQSIIVDLKKAGASELFLKLVEKADVVIDPYRPGVCEKLGIGPEQCHIRNPKLIFARMTGWGQTGPLSHAAGHDINYIAITGALHAIGEKDRRPLPPLNLVGDMGGGGMLLVNGILAALLESHHSGVGQVVDAAMVDGAAQQMWMMHNMQANGQWNEQNRESNMLDGGAHFYNTYQCSDGKYICIACIEPQFYKLFVDTLNLGEEFADQNNQNNWPSLKKYLDGIFSTKTQDQWCDIFQGSDICFAPVLDFIQATNYLANQARQVYINVDNLTQPSPAPRFSRTASTIKHGGHSPGHDSRQILSNLDFDQNTIQELFDQGIVA